MSDLIDREEAIDRIVKIRPSDKKKSDYTHGIDVGLAMAIVAIKEQPSRQTERRMYAQIGEDTSHPCAESVMMGMDGEENETN